MWCCFPLHFLGGGVFTLFPFGGGASHHPLERCFPHPLSLLRGGGAAFSTPPFVFCSKRSFYACILGEREREEREKHHHPKEKWHHQKRKRRKAPPKGERRNHSTIRKREGRRLHHPRRGTAATLQKRKNVLADFLQSTNARKGSAQT